MEYLHEFETQAACTAFVNSADYKEPFTALIDETSGVSYNQGSTPPPVDYSSMPLTIEITNGSGSFKLRNSTFDSSTLSYSLNGSEYTNINDYTSLNVSNGDIIQLKGYNCVSVAGMSQGETMLLELSNNNLEYVVYGNIMSLVRTENFENMQSFPDTGMSFSCLFGGDYYVSYKLQGLISAENLILPVTALTENCYDRMFYNCINLTTAPVLPATTLSTGCYINMFADCTSLTTAPALPATTLAENCYSSMFSGCRSLTTAPSLPATTLANSCYSTMFYGCTSLTTAPELPALTLADGCYSEIFNSYSSLSYIKCLATDISAEYSTDYWVNGVSETGTFVKNPNMSSWTTGTSGIPNNWTVQDAS